MFQKVDAYAGDPILSLMERFKEDPRSDKVNLSIGLYYNDDGIIPQLQAVAEAEARLNAEPHGASLYLPMAGLSGYRQAIAPLLFGADNPVLQQQRVATIQTLGGSGALKVGADFLKRYFPDSGVWVSDPTWENHVAIFEGAGFNVATYPWFDSETNGVRVEALLEKYPAEFKAKVQLLENTGTESKIGRQVMNASNIVALASGTATLEAMLLHRPMVTFYQLNWLTYHVVKFLIKIPYYSLPNIIAGKKVIQELIQKDATPEKLATEIEKLMNVETAQIQAMQHITMHKQLLSGNSEDPVQAILSILAQP